MPDDKDKPIKVGSITQTADLMGERAGEVSNVSKTINEMQRDVNQRITEVEQQFGDTEGIQEVQEATVGILRKMSSAMGSFADGVNSVTSGVAGATKDAISQYGKAISEDISYNKQSLVATALSRTTPLFGYFAAKFMETDVFKSAKERMKQSLGQAFSGIGKTISGFFGGKKMAKMDKEEKVPKMQSGGYVKKGGMVEVHAGEIVAPIEKVLDKVDATVSATQDLAKITKRAQLNTLAKMGTFVRSNEEMQKVGLFKGFMRAMRQVQTQYEEPSNIRQLRATLAIQDALGASIGTWPQVWQKILVEHPTFRNMMFFLRGMSNMFIKYPARIAYAVFKSRGGYQGQLAQSKNPFEALNFNVGLLYSEGMWRLDNIAKFTKAGAEATRDLSSYVTGTKYPPLTGVRSRAWSILSIGKAALNFTSKWLPAVIGGAIAGKKGWKKGEGIGDWLTKERESWFLKFASLFRGSAEYQSIYGIGGRTKKFIGMGKEEDDLQGAVALGGPQELYERLKYIMSQVPSNEAAFPVKLIAYDGEAEIIEEQKEKEGENLLSGVNSLYDGWKKQHKSQKDMAKDIDQMNKRQKRKGITGLFGGIFSGIGGIFSKLFGGGLLGMGGGLLRLLGFGKGGLLSKALTTLFGKAGALLPFLTNPAFLGPLAAAVGGIMVGTWLNKYIGPWLNKKWDKMFSEGRKAQEKTVAESWEKSKVARKTEGMEGLSAKYATAMTKQTFQQQQEAGYGTDPKLGLIQKGQMEYFNANVGEYMKYPVDMLSAWRSEWYESDDALGPRAHIFGWGSDPIEFGKKREMHFLRWLAKNKKARTEAEIQAAAKAWTQRVRGAQGLKGDLKNMRDKVVDYATDKYKIAEQAVSQQVAAGLVAADATLAAAQEQGLALKEHAKEMGEGLQQQTTNIVSSVADNSTRAAGQAADTARNYYNDVKGHAITGKMDDVWNFD